MVEIIEPNFKFCDERGSFAQLVREGYRQINVLISKVGIKRGGHYHKLNREVFYVISGSLDLLVNTEGESKTYHFKAGEMFVILPLTVHELQFTEDTVMVSMYDKGVEMEDGEKDIYSS